MIALHTSRMEWLLLVYHGKEKEQKLMRWDMWNVRIKEHLKKSEENLASLKSKGEPKDKQDIEEHVILANVSSPKKRVYVHVVVIIVLQSHVVEQTICSVIIVKLQWKPVNMDTKGT